VWRFDGLAALSRASRWFYDGKVIFGAWDEHLYALDARTGKLAWKWKGDKRGVLLSPAACWPVAASGKVFIVATDRKLTAIDSRTASNYGARALTPCVNPSVWRRTRRGSTCGP